MQFYTPEELDTDNKKGRFHPEHDIADKGLSEIVLRSWNQRIANRDFLNVSGQRFCPGNGKGIITNEIAGMRWLNCMDGQLDAIDREVLKTIIYK